MSATPPTRTAQRAAFGTIGWDELCCTGCAPLLQSTIPACERHQPTTHNKKCTGRNAPPVMQYLRERASEAGAKEESGGVARSQ